MVLLNQNDQTYNNDIRAMIMAFFPGVKIREAEDIDEKIMFSFAAEYGEDVTHFELVDKDAETKIYTKNVPGDYRDKATFRNKLKRALYDIMVSYTGRKLPWGDLTGVRPTKIAMKRLTAGDSCDEAVRYYIDEYEATEEKAKLAVEVAGREMTMLDDIDSDRDYCLYVGIPFCPSRCLYCSFTSYPIAIYRDKAVSYIDVLCRELDYIAEKMKNKRLVAIYVGGGTPSSIDAELMDKLLSKINNTFALDSLKEFTVEAGRPDSIDRDKLTVMKKHGVSRISINPQTMNDETLRTIGRAHDSAQTREAFALARELGFDNINMDIIAGLPGEDADSMAYTLSEISKLSPESLTVHSLAIKRAANLKKELPSMGDEIHHDMDEMLHMVNVKAEELGMKPYYLYRQKNIGGNLENVGYAKPDTECLYNVLIMEEVTDIIAAGAGASTKLVYKSENRVERVENCKSVDDYIGRFDEMISRKEKMMDTE